MKMLRCWMPLIFTLCATIANGQPTVNSLGVTIGEHPRDSVGVVGGIVTLRCVVQNKGPHSVYWFRHGAHKYLSRDKRIFNLPGLSTFMSRISIQGNARFGEFNLRIANVSIDDNDQYSCMYFLGQQFIGMSDPASLTVYVPPNSGGPSCEMQPPANVGPGVKVKMVCTSTGALPYTRLDWKHRVEILPGTLVQGPRPKALYEVKLTEMDNGASYTCEESSPALYKPRTCQLRPFLMPTNVTVNREPHMLSAGADVIVTCNAQAVPQQVNYTWTINNMNLTVINDPRIKIVDGGRRLRITQISAEDNGTLVMCSAKNVLNLESSDYTTLTLDSDKLQSVAQTGGSSKNVAIIAGVLGTLAVLVFAAFVAVKKKRHMTKEKPRVHQPRDSDCEYLDEHGFGGVAICNTPRDAIAEHMKQNDQDKSPNEDGETATRVLLVAGPPKPPIKPVVLPPISPLFSHAPPVTPRKLPSDEIPQALPSMAKHRQIGGGSPVKKFPVDRLPGMPGKYHSKGPLPRPPRVPTSPLKLPRQESDFLRC